MRSNSHKPQEETRMKFAIVGAGAIGAYLGAKLARSGEDVILIARGAHLATMQAQGLRVIELETGDEFAVHPQATDDIAAVAEADVVVLTVKAHSVTPIAQTLSAALRPDAALVTAQNGIPWWYFERYEGPLAHTHLRCVDPDGTLARLLPVEHVVGCVVWPAASIVEPGVVEHVEGTRFTLGEPDGVETERVRAISAALTNAGLKAPITPEIRTDIWLKLLGNVVFNPLSALTHATLGEIVAQPDLRVVARAMMVEVNSVARRLGVEVLFSIDSRLEGAGKVGNHKTSMLQDLEAGRPMELEPMVGAVVELGRLLDMPLPHLNTAYACVKMLEQAAYYNHPSC